VSRISQARCGELFSYLQECTHAVVTRYTKRYLRCAPLGHAGRYCLAVPFYPYRIAHRQGGSAVTADRWRGGPHRHKQSGRQEPHSLMVGPLHQQTTETSGHAGAAV